MYMNNKERKIWTENVVNVLFYLRKSKKCKKTGLVPLHMRISYKGDRKELSTKRKVDPNKWDADAQKVKGYGEDAQTLNTYLKAKENEVLKYYNSLILNDSEVSLDLLVMKAKGITDKKKTLLGLFDDYLKDADKKVKKEKLAQTRRDKYDYNYTKLKRFLKSINRTDVNLSELNLKFINDYDTYLAIEEGLGTNTVVGYCKMMKALMTYGVNMGIIDRNPFIGYTESFTETNPIILNAEELLRVEEVKLYNTTLNEIRDFFLFCCYTGTAFIDAKNITPENITLGMDGTYWLSYEREKSGVFVSFPIIDDAINILKKYNSDLTNGNEPLLPSYCNQYTNRQLKLIAAYSQISKPLTTHTGRYTFATTVSSANEVPREIVQMMLGHKNASTTAIYAKIGNPALVKQKQIMDEKLNGFRKMMKAS